MKRILLVLASSGWGGTEKVFVQLANHLAGRFEVIALVPAGCAYMDRFSDGVEIRHLREGSRRNPFVLRDLSRLIRELEPDIVHSHAAKATEMVYWSTTTRRVRHVATKHNTRPRWIFGRVPWVVAVSEQAAESIDHERGVTVIHNGVEPKRVERTESTDAFTLISVGRLHEHKGFDVLLRAVSRLDFDFELRIVGEGRERQALEALIDELGLGVRVKLLGHREDVPELLAAAHLQVVSSRTEGFSLALVEGLYYSNIVISTPVGIAPTLLPADFMCDAEGLADRITAVHADYEGFVARFQDVKTESRDRFVFSKTVDAYAELYEEVLATAR